MELPEGVLALLHCPICLDIPLGAVLQCLVGHTICEGCRLKVNECPKCKSPITSTKNLLAQKLAEKVNVICKYARFGCKEKFAGQERLHHHNNCSFRTMICKIHLPTKVCCGEEVKKDEYLQHILKIHSAKSLQESDNSVYSVDQGLSFELSQKTKLVGTDLPRILHIKNCGTDFLVVTGPYDFLTPRWAVYVVESDKEEKEHWATITLQNPHTKVELSFKAPAQPVGLSLEEISESGMCLAISRKTVNAISHYNPKTQNAKWNLMVTFHNVDESSESDSGTESTSRRSLSIKPQSCKMEKPKNPLQQSVNVTPQMPPSPNKTPTVVGSATSYQLIPDTVRISQASTRAPSVVGSTGSSCQSIPDAIGKSLAIPKTPTVVASAASYQSIPDTVRISQTSTKAPSVLGLARSCQSIPDGVGNGSKIGSPGLVWPLSADPSKVINIAVRADFDWKENGGCGVCIISGKGKISFYSTCLPNDLAESDAKTNLEYQAQTAIKVMSTFKKFFTAGSKVYVSCPENLDQVGEKGSYLNVLREQLENLKRSRVDLQFVFIGYDQKRSETNGVNLLMIDKGMCDKELGKAGIREFVG